jgi:hypothetical protein
MIPKTGLISSYILVLLGTSNPPLAMAIGPISRLSLILPSPSQQLSPTLSPVQTKLTGFLPCMKNILPFKKTRPSNSWSFLHLAKLSPASGLIESSMTPRDVLIATKLGSLPVDLLNAKVLTIRRPFLQLPNLIAFGHCYPLLLLRTLISHNSTFAPPFFTAHWTRKYI